MYKRQEANKITVMDLTPDNSGKWLETIGESLKYCDYFMPSVLEARGITGLDDPSEMAEALYKLGPKNVVVKAGGRGCYFRNEQGLSLIHI